MFKSILSIFILTTTLTSCFNLFGEPQTTLVKTSPNYDNTKKAVLFQNDGNATVDLSLHVAILNFDTKLFGKELGNAFIVDGNHGEAVLDSVSINFNWISNDSLQIDFDKKLRIFIQEKKVDGVTIVYKAR